ncbi:ComEC/Rec2 family competence protein [uncultured Megamonas sp.]|uniref:ComEC/Rec2 family competence protein n=1 Tax=uncultured Megamonas sp. TaxID=286140 RepID=UPI0025E641C0|nr:ComEC/Rec2 family competence protein [uncultured Megamonas sp.]
MKKIIALLMILCSVFLWGCGKDTATQSGSKEGKLKIEMLDIGQGDATLIQTGEQTIMIDTGDIDERDNLVKLLKERNITTIDKLIITHPHADHLGGAYAVFKNFDVKEVYDNGDPTTTQTYKTYLKNIKEKKIKYQQLSAGDELDFGDGVKFKIFSPTKQMLKSEDDLNNNSLVGQLKYKDFTMMFTGDAEKEAEANMVKTYGNELSSLVLKSPHHGSRTSSSEVFLKQLNANTVLISLGAGNEYGHPHKQTMDRYKKLNMKVYETDKNGSITIISDGSKDYQITTEK